jgi:hypothetical protein
MNLHAHPYTWAAELAWRRESMEHTGLGRTGGRRPGRRARRRRTWRLPSPRRALVLARRTAPRSGADAAAQHAWPVATGLAAR